MTTNVDQLTKLSNQLSTRSDSPIDGPLFNSLLEMIGYVEACHLVETGIMTDKDTVEKAAEYNRRIKQFVDMTKGKNLTRKEQNKILYGGK